MMLVVSDLADITPPLEAAPHGDSENANAIAAAEARLEALGEVLEMGMALARSLAHPGGETPQGRRRDPIGAFVKVSRCIRLTIALQARLDDDLIALREGRLP